jgi:FAD/FMN-containing dehydrogenase
MSVRILGRDDAGYESARVGAVWNGRKPERRPEFIALAQTTEDVVEVVEFARERGLRIATRSGGHNFVGNCLRDDGLLLDVSKLNEVSIDAGNRRAVVGPGCRSEELLTACTAVGLAFGVGHCPSVAMGGFLTSGGMGFNPCEWGYGCMSVHGIDVVTADGKLVHATRESNADLLWAARGGGPGFYGVITSFHLELFPNPVGLATSTYTFPLALFEDVAAWLDGVADTLSPVVEPMVWMGNLEGHIVGELDEAGDHGSGGVDERVFMINAVAFATSREEAISALAPFEACPQLDQAIDRDVARAVSFTDLFDFQRVLYPKGLRYAVDCAWTRTPVSGQPLAELREHMRNAPSPRTHALWMLPFAGFRGGVPDMALSHLGRYFISFYTVWQDEHEDEANIAWLREALDILEPISTGHYSGDVDLVAAPTRATGTLEPDRWERFQSLRSQLDPDGRFQPHLGLG